MKVNVLQVHDAKFHNCFHYWSKWVDVCLYDFQSTPFLLQMSVSRLNKKKFRSVRVTGSITYRQARATDIGDLTQMEGK